MDKLLQCPGFGEFNKTEARFWVKCDARFTIECPKLWAISSSNENARVRILRPVGMEADDLSL